MCKIGIRKRFSSQRLTHQPQRPVHRTASHLPQAPGLPLGPSSAPAGGRRPPSPPRSRPPSAGPAALCARSPATGGSRWGRDHKGLLSERPSLSRLRPTPTPHTLQDQIPGPGAASSGKSPGRTHHGGVPADRDVPAGQAQAPGPAGSARPPVGPPGSHRPRLLSSPGHSQQRLGGQEGEYTLHHLRQVTQHEGAPGVCGGAAVAAAARQLHSSPRAPAAEPRLTG